MPQLATRNKRIQGKERILSKSDSLYELGIGLPLLVVGHPSPADSLCLSFSRLLAILHCVVWASSGSWLPAWLADLAEANPLVLTSCCLDGPASILLIAIGMVYGS